MTVIPTSTIRQRARRNRGLSALTDLEASSYSDNEIIAASFGTWRSRAYQHYDIYLDRIAGAQSTSTIRLVFRFECKHGHPSHLPQFRDRMKTGNGTQNLLSSAKTCDARWGATQSSNSPPHFSSYSEARHRVLIALRCAQNKRSFNSVTDSLYRQEVELLRPGTVLPSPSTVSRDIQTIYASAADSVKEYFKEVPGAVHFAIDGWTSPQASSFLGLIAIWRDQGKIWRSILEFVHLTHAHKGDYLASRVAECLRRYGIDNKILSICLDNASNNNTLVDNLALLIPSFRGASSRVRCLAHIINLMAKAFLSLFTRPPRRRKPVELPVQPAIAQPTTPAQDSNLVENNDDEDTDDINKPETDPDKQDHDDRVVQKHAQKALELMAIQKVVPTRKQLEDGRSLMPKVAGLARRVHASPPLREKFEGLAVKSATSDRRMLTERVDTRWDTDYDCLDTHIHFKVPTQLLTEESKLGLRSYKLNEEQWALADEMVTVLEIFKERTKRFSLAEVPLLHETLPELSDMRLELQAVCDDTIDMSPLTRVAAQAAILVYDKYIGKMSKESEMYYIAVGKYIFTSSMLPN